MDRINSLLFQDGHGLSILSMLTQAVTQAVTVRIGLALVLTFHVYSPFVLNVYAQRLCSTVRRAARPVNTLAMIQRWTRNHSGRDPNQVEILLAVSTMTRFTVKLMTI